MNPIRMLKVIRRSVAARWATLTGSFLALALGTALITVMCRVLSGAAGLPASEELTTVVALLGTAAGVTGFVSVFVVASTFSYAVAQRRRELGLLRLAGASRAQVRRMVLGEAAVLGVAASGAGCALGGYAAPDVVRRLVSQRLAPEALTAGSAAWPYHVAFWTGLTVALTGVAAAACRAGRVAPTEALREAEVDERVMTPGRWAAAGTLLATAIVLLGWRLATDPGELLHRKTYTVQPMLLVTAVALLAPVTVGPLSRLAGRALPGWAGRVVRGSAAGSVRRTGALAAPVLLAVALAGSLLGTAQTVGAAKAREAAARTRAEWVVTGPVRATDVERVRQLAGARALVSAPTVVESTEDSDQRIAWEARAVDPHALTALTALPVTAGRVGDLDDRSIVVTEEWLHHGVGTTVPVWRADGTHTDLRIAAVLRTGTGDNGVYVTPANAPGATADRLEVRGVTGAALRAAVADGPPAAHGRTEEPGAERKGATASALRIRTAEQWLTDTHPRTSRATRAGFILVLGIALLYGMLVLANTLVMSTTDRVRDLAVLRLAGATKGLVLTVVAAETLLVVTTGALLGTAVAAVNLAGVATALALLGVGTTIVVPWTTLAALTAACTAVALPAAVVPAWRALRVRPVERLKAA
ncbi:FtsX-like permease family protein [Streptomyces coffeae]|uniref:FtsX-like permease family protein n=1 Tax=Streptomyces coffeae TaxID=621382 RepID=A0ABS1NCW3_9ACTN|nr:ABC transporter permease [Streptomyces coffeae]MBL1097922.1 FtsX-like permease family protein [Streptomyces coffeae]